MTTRIAQFEELTLPKGERLIWQGRPGVRALAIHVFHVRLAVGYFALLFAARIAISWFEEQPLPDALQMASRIAVPFLIVMALLLGLAVLYSRTTRYSITNRRLLLQFGAVLPMTLNVPFKQVASAAVKQYADGSGDLPLSVITEQRLAFLLLWPHVRPWKLNRVEPMLRGVKDARHVADVLATALAAASSQSPEPVEPAMSVPRPAVTPAIVATAA